MLGFCGFTFLFSSGIVGVTNKPNHVFATPGCFCHADTASVNVRTWVEGPDSIGAGETGLFSLHVAKDSSVAAGFNVAAFFGSIGILDSTGTQLMNPSPSDSAELTHIQPRLAAGRDTVSWQFYYHAPATPGIVDTLYSCGNSVDFTGDTFGDEWAFGSVRLLRIVDGATHVSSTTPVFSFVLDQNYPNPFNPSTTIHFSLSLPAYATMRIFDIRGKEVARPVDGRLEAGAHSVSFVPHPSVSSGVYVYQLRVNGNRGESVFSRKMLYVK